MKMKSKVVIGISVATLSLGLFFQNCAKIASVDFNAGNQTSASLGQGDGAAGAGDSKGGQVSFRTIQLNPEFATNNSADHPLKLLLLVDNSNSMLKSREKLAAGIESLLEPLKAFYVDVRIINTSEFTGVSDKAKLADLGWVRTEATLGKQVPEVLRNKFSIGPKEYFGMYSYDVQYFQNGNNTFKISQNDSQFSKIKSEIQNRIVQLSSGGGSNREQGLCNILLTMYDQGPNRFFNPSDMAGIVVLSDENDQSVWGYDRSRSSCFNRYTYGSLVNPDQSGRDRADYNITIFSARFKVRYKYDNDGIIEDRIRDDNGGIPLGTEYEDFIAGVVAAKTPWDKVSCPKEFYEKAVVPYAGYLAPRVGGTEVIVEGCHIEPYYYPVYDYREASINYCEKNEKTAGLDLYSNFRGNKNFMGKGLVVKEGSCRRNVSTIPSSRQFGDFWLVGATDPEVVNPPPAGSKEQQASIKRAIINKARALFGDKGLFIGNIVHLDNQCLVDSKEQSIGTDYMNLAMGSVYQGFVQSQSLCSADYGVALKTMSLVIKDIVEQRVSITDINAWESIDSIYVKRDGKTLELNQGSDYVVKDNVISFVSFQLQRDDQVQVVLKAQH